jgi:hypothetical protein
MRGLQTKQPAADDHPGAPTRHRGLHRALRGDPDRVEILRRPVDVATGEVVTRHWGHERRRPGGQHQRVVTNPAPGRGAHGALAPVDPHARVAQAKLHPVVGDRRQRQRLGIP